VNGTWTTEWYEPDARGRFVRPPTQFSGAVAPEPDAPFPAEPDRYHLYVSLACPWAHRTLIFRTLKRLEGVIGLSIVDPFMGDDGWFFSDYPGSVPDTVNGARFLRDIYLKARPDYTGRVTVPVLWDRRTGTIVSNDSLAIIRMLDRAFDRFGDKSVRFFPDGPAGGAVDQMIAANYDTINNGVYRAGFATTQTAYEEAVWPLFERLRLLDERLARQRYLMGDRITAADWTLFTTLFRFDAVYHSHFKCNVRRLVDFPHLWPYVRDLYAIPGVASVCDLDHVKQHYYRSHPTLNPTRIVPVGPALDFSAPHGRERLGQARDGTGASAPA
jgi:putative glutathione S-transferase